MRFKFKLPLLRAKTQAENTVLPDDQVSELSPEAQPAELIQPPPSVEALVEPTASPEPPPIDEHAEAEAALARLEDRIGAFTAYTLAADFLELRQIYQGTFERTKEEDWAKKLDRRAEGWTRRQALAHVAALTHTYNQMISAGIAEHPVDLPGFTQRNELKAFNQAAVAASAETPVAELADSLLAALEDAARLVALLEHDQLGKLVATPLFNTPPTVAELFGCSLAHAGLIHGAQLALNRSRPIWIYFPPGMMRRQLTRCIHMFGLAYWPERGGELHAAIGVSVEGQGGGSWVVRLEPESGQGKIGIVRTTDLSLSFASADLFCRTVTYQTQIWRQVALRRLRVSGNLRLARRLSSLFQPT